MWIGPDRIDSHFGTYPVYGTLAESARAVAADLSQGVAAGRPAGETGAALERSSVNYYGNATGYLVHLTSGTDLPAVVVIHKWLGLNQHIKDAADRLASERYVVLAADPYSSEVATESSRAGQLAGSVRNNPGEAINNPNAAVEHVHHCQTWAALG